MLGNFAYIKLSQDYSAIPNTSEVSTISILTKNMLAKTTKLPESEYVIEYQHSAIINQTVQQSTDLWACYPKTAKTH